MTYQSLIPLQAELEDLCFAVLHPYEYKALRNELNAMWGLQQMTDLVPAQAETLLNQAAASVRTAADIAASSDIPRPRLPTASPVPRPNLLRPSDQQASPQDTGSSHDSRQQSMQNVQKTPGDLYASSERGMVRTAGRPRINSRQQKALRSGLLRLSSPIRQAHYGGAAAVLEPPRTLPSSSSPPVHSAALAQSIPGDNKPQSAQSANSSLSSSEQQSHDHAALSNLGPDVDSSAANRHLDTSLEASPSQSRATSDSPDSESTSSQAGSHRAVDQGFQRVIRGRTPRRALAAEMAAKAERQNSGAKAGPSGRVTPDFSFLSLDQQRVSHPRCSGTLSFDLPSSPN